MIRNAIPDGGVPVFFEKAESYGDPRLERRAAELLEAAGVRPKRGTRVLVKPNLVAPKNMGLSCTSPAVVRAACLYLLDCGAGVTVGDSPAFGTAKVVARLSGLTAALADLPVRLVNFSRSRRVPLSFGKSAAVAAHALDAELIVNLPKLKVHNQMGMTAAVKNMFGCVTGFRKSLAHQLYGEKGNRFPRLIIDVMESLPETVSLLDGITAMHREGPAGGDPFPLGLLAAAPGCVALDTAVYGLFGLSPDEVPLWSEALAMGLAGARPEEVRLARGRTEDFPVQGFERPARLEPVAFHPKRFVTGRVKSMLTRFR